MIDVAALGTYAFVMSITPGPNNVMLTTSGVAFGFARTLPHMVGISLGFALQAVLTVLGLGAVFTAVQGLQSGLAWVGAAYLCYLGWRLLGAGAAGGGARGARPLRAWEGAAFQFANPKAWVMAVTVGVVFVPASAPLASALPIVFVVLVAVNFPCLCAWTAVGESMRGWLADPRRRRVFNAVMAILLAATAVMMVWPTEPAPSHRGSGGSLSMRKS